MDSSEANGVEVGADVQADVVSALPEEGASSDAGGAAGAVDADAGAAASPRVGGPPPAATTKPASAPGEENRCQMVVGTSFSGTPLRCPTIVASRTSSALAMLLTTGVMGLLYPTPDAKHHCKHCLKRVCPAHFTITEGGSRLCTECAAAGVVIAASPKAKAAASPKAKAATAEVDADVAADAEPASAAEDVAPGPVEAADPPAAAAAAVEKDSE